MPWTLIITLYFFAVVFIFRWYPKNHTLDDNIQWCWLRAVEWGKLPLYVSQLIVPFSLLDNNSIGSILIGVIAWNNLLWPFVRYKAAKLWPAIFIADACSSIVCYSKWPLSIGMAIYFFNHHQNSYAAFCLFYPIIVMLMTLIPPSTMVGYIQKLFAADLDRKYGTNIYRSLDFYLKTTANDVPGSKTKNHILTKIGNYCLNQPFIESPELIECTPDDLKCTPEDLKKFNLRGYRSNGPLTEFNGIKWNTAIFSMYDIIYMIKLFLTMNESDFEQKNEVFKITLKYLFDELGIPDEIPSLHTDRYIWKSSEGTLTFENLPENKSINLFIETKSADKPANWDQKVKFHSGNNSVTTEKSPTAKQPNIINLAASIVEASYQCAQDINSIRNKTSSNSKDESSKLLEIRDEILYWFLHLTMRISFGKYGNEKRIELQNTLAPILSLMAFYFDEKTGTSRYSVNECKDYFYKGMNTAELDYSKCTELIVKPGEGRKLSDGLHFRLGMNISQLADHDANPAMIMYVVKVTSDKLSELKLNELIDKAIKEV
ncbi:MAG: hypothetical protein PHW04_01195 [Candidatus Wallbacteria bacterium]|nr:hypothetical protein [Candidatus Wallbacteria bacterium]